MKINWKRIFTLFTCFVLVCCILVNISPIKAEATDLATNALVVGLTAEAFIPSLFSHFGVFPDYVIGNPDPSATTLYELMLEDAADVVADTCDFVFNVAGGEVIDTLKCFVIDDLCYVPRDVIEDVLEYFVSSEYVTHDTTYLLPYNEDGTIAWTLFDLPPLPSSVFSKTKSFLENEDYKNVYLVITKNYSNSISSQIFMYIVGTSYASVVSSSSVKLPHPSTYFVWYCTPSSTSWNQYSIGTWSTTTSETISLMMGGTQRALFRPTSVLVAEEGITLENFGETLEDEVYSEWVGSAITMEDGKQYLPVTLPEETTYYTSGGTVTVPGTGTGGNTGTDTETPVVPVPDITVDLEAVASASGLDASWVDVWSTLGSSWTADANSTEHAISLGTFSVVSVLGNVIDAILGLPISIGDVLSDWLAEIIAQLTGVATATDVMSITVADVLEEVIALPGAIWDVLVDALAHVFVPSETFLNTQVVELRDQFPFIDSGLELMDALGSAVDGAAAGSAPVIYIDLPAGEGSIYWGPRTILMDLTWYERYKPSVDAIMSGFLWAVFAWKMLLKLPGLLSAVPGEFIMDDARSAGLVDYLSPMVDNENMYRKAYVRQHRSGHGSGSRDVFIPGDKRHSKKNKKRK